MKDYFETIVGYEDIKKELRMISDMLNNPEIYRKLGAKINEGILLRGRPGTGKTTMANCLINSTDRKVFVCRKKSSDGKFVKKVIFHQSFCWMTSISFLIRISTVMQKNL